MEYNGEKLRELYEKATRKHKLTAELDDLEQQRETLAYNAEVQRHVMELEEADVKKLEKASISNFFIELFGNMGEKMNNERREAYEAALKYRSAVQELEFVEKEIAKRQSELSGLEDCETLLEKEIAAAVDAAKISGHPDAVKIVELERKILEQSNKICELKEAVSAGKIAAACVEPIMKNLDSAENWGVFDLLGGGIISSFAKHEKLRQAQNEIDNLHMHLRTLRTELADVQIEDDMSVELDDFTAAADWFFDGILVDGYVLNKIQASKQKIYELKNRIDSLIDRLESSQRQAEAEISRLKAALEQVVVG